MFNGCCSNSLEKFKCIYQCNETKIVIFDFKKDQPEIWMNMEPHDPPKQHGKGENREGAISINHTWLTFLRYAELKSQNRLLYDCTQGNRKDKFYETR